MQVKFKIEKKKTIRRTSFPNDQHLGPIINSISPSVRHSPYLGRRHSIQTLEDASKTQMNFSLPPPLQMPCLKFPPQIPMEKTSNPIPVNDQSNKLPSINSLITTYAPPPSIDPTQSANTEDNREDPQLQKMISQFFGFSTPQTVNKIPKMNQIESHCEDNEMNQMQY